MLTLNSTIKSVTGSFQSASMLARFASTHHKVLVVGGGSAGISVAHQIYNKFSKYRFANDQGKDTSLKPGEIGIVDGAKYHYYQPGWTLTGAGLSSVAKTRRELASLVPADKFKLHPEFVKSLHPRENKIVTQSGQEISYDYLVMAAGIYTDFGRIKGLTEALDDPNTPVVTIYSEKYADAVYPWIEKTKSGNAIFTQPSGVLKCAGAPQKIMWMAEDYWRRHKVRSNIDVSFYTGMPTLFSVKRYSDALLRQNEQLHRNVKINYKDELVEVKGSERKAVFKNLNDGSLFERPFDLLHAVPSMRSHEFIAKSDLADKSGFVAVDQSTTQSTKFPNVFAIGDCSGLPTSKTYAAITAQAPVMVHNLWSFVNGKNLTASYNGYTSCPLLTGYGKLILAEFLYKQEPKESFGRFSRFLDQTVPRRMFYHLKKDFFPFVYWNFAVRNGKWYGSRGLIPPHFPVN
ncbi:sulfide-quinone oxidoreductase [Schizosaccharomyces pombe]|uniref:Sulfide:quinone oxidoreductase, mitochondrial n=1 Tax=Schizosaccharomyces pombe (strain 972 / ATCC 24843) TaxID=284812 RepID=HMT2_SCHPO|nr:sulfide-quinone oxidoreductase [Schizosaccharomyces pombe]O94284.1 RecName: Full=Sulfide:quinone oxidoreductase, mitochondrial; AltName: Full=Cadmium resistance protein 1; AltName: Full=Heavy metal tolerance protein 2; Flags: Precursor [Schizosaccharomyces pombe 972h-]AAD41159.1 sulfide dehydrogenase [Schizosaccharomyces pombe]CAA21882.1 sulfide-quinone oxidoreductase [Schizosaccharomyces pombe]|eukprot:NP_596067.1 sulfide-quinone oxidoreductase [Schizosaccharomyces pombe]